MSVETWNFDPAHSNVGFSVRHLVISKVRGRFKSWTGTFAFDTETGAPSSIDVTIDTASIDTAEAQRDAHLRSPDFFDAETFPKLNFRSTAVKPSGDDTLSITGDLTIRDVTRSVTLDTEYGGRVKDPWGNDRLGFTARTSVSRKDFGLTWNQLLEAGGVAVGDKVEISIEVEVVKAA